MSIWTSIKSYINIGDFMLNPTVSIDKNLHIIYNENGKSFEELLAEGVRQVNLKTIQKRIISDATPKIKECSE
ncbi:MAG: hypothetical protein FWC91_06400 [Defluviitaleaceae bacterium]|nr:hypothetical protein [Defluviitaleaceae bacterium]